MPSTLASLSLPIVASPSAQCVTPRFRTAAIPALARHRFYFVVEENCWVTKEPKESNHIRPNVSSKNSNAP